MNESYAEACKDVSLDNEDPEMFEYLKSLAKTVFMCWENKVEQDKLVYVDYCLAKDFDNTLKRLEMVKTN